MSDIPKVTRKKISDYTPDPHNANQGTERGLRALDDSIAQVGLGRSIVVDKNGYIIAGNKTTDRSFDSGFEDAIEIETDGKQLVVVRRNDLDLMADDPNNPARKMAYLDNRVSELDLNWNPETIFADLQAGVDLSGMFREDELNSLLSSITSPDFQPVGMDEQPRLDQLEPKWIICPHCSEKFDLRDVES